MKKLLALVVLSAFLIGADKPDDAGAAKSKPLKGTWKVVSQKHGDDDIPDENKAGQLIFEADKFLVKRGDDVLLEGTFKIDSSTSPAQIDFTVTKDNEAQGRAGQKSLGIYKLDGDKLKLCACDVGHDERPDKLDSAGTDFILLVMERSKK